jgi:hypothetical protein
MFGPALCGGRRRSGASTASLTNRPAPGFHTTGFSQRPNLGFRPVTEPRCYLGALPHISGHGGRQRPTSQPPGPYHSPGLPRRASSGRGALMGECLGTSPLEAAIEGLRRKIGLRPSGDGTVVELLGWRIGPGIASLARKAVLRPMNRGRHAVPVGAAPRAGGGRHHVPPFYGETYKARNLQGNHRRHRGGGLRPPHGL